MTERINVINQRTIEKTSTIKTYAEQACKSKMKKCIGICAAVAAVLLSFILPIMFAGMSGEVNKIKGYSKTTPLYEDYQGVLIQYLYTDSGNGYYVLSDNPNSDEFREYIKDRIGNKSNYVTIVYNNDMQMTKFKTAYYRDFDKVNAEVEETFNSVVKEITHEANQVYAKVWLEILIFILVIVAIAAGIAFWYTRSIREYIGAAERGEYRLQPGTLVGREEYETGNSHNYYLEIEVTESGKQRIKVDAEMFDKYQSGKLAYVIIWNKGYGLFDDNDIIIS